MNAGQYVLGAYAVGLGLMLFYALVLWRESRRIARRERINGGRQ